MRYYLDAYLDAPRRLVTPRKLIPLPRKTRTQAMPVLKLRGCIIRVVNTHCNGRHKYEWEITPYMPRAIHRCGSKDTTYDPTSWQDARSAQLMAAVAVMSLYKSRFV